jgi:hypothetical protein
MIVRIITITIVLYSLFLIGKIVDFSAYFPSKKESSISVSDQAYLVKSSSKQQSDPKSYGQSADLAQIWSELQVSSEIWPMVTSLDIKKAIIGEYIKFYYQRGIKIKKSSESYLTLINEVVAGNPTLLENPFADVIRFVAVLEYDFDNGTDRDEMAKKVLGEKLYQDNRHRFGR